MAKENKQLIKRIKKLICVNTVDTNLIATGYTPVAFYYEKITFIVRFIGHDIAYNII